MKLLKVHNWNCQVWRAPGRTFPSANASLLLEAAGRCDIFVRGPRFPQGSPGSSHGALQDVQKGSEMLDFLAKLSSCPNCAPIHGVCWASGFALPQSWHPLLASELANATECVWGLVRGALELPELHWSICHRGPAQPGWAFGKTKLLPLTMHL